MKPIFILLLSFLISEPLFAHDSIDHNQGISIEQAWAPHTGKRTMSAAVYMTIRNDGDQKDTLIEVKTDQAAQSMLHQSKDVNGIMRMEHVERLDIPAGGTVQLAPGGHHIMLMQLAHPLKRGDVFPLDLVFEKAGKVRIFVEIVGIGGPDQEG